MSRPKSPDPTAPVNWRVPVVLLDRAREAADLDGLAPGAWLARAIEDALSPPAPTRAASPARPPSTPTRPTTPAATIAGRAPIGRRQVEPRWKGRS